VTRQEGNRSPVCESMSLQVCDSASLLGSGGVVRLLMLQSTVTLLSSFVSSVHASLSFLFLLDHVSDCCIMVSLGVSMWDDTWAGIVSLALSLRFDQLASLCMVIAPCMLFVFAWMLPTDCCFPRGSRSEKFAAHCCSWGVWQLSQWPGLSAVL